MEPLLSSAHICEVLSQAGLQRMVQAEQPMTEVECGRKMPCAQPHAYISNSFLESDVLEHA